MRLAEGKAPSNSPFSIAFDTVQSGSYTHVRTAFDFRLTPVFGAADGLGFYLMDTGIYGHSGRVPDFSGGGFEPNISGVFATVFDIFNNAQGSNNPSEPNNNHISVHNDGALISVFEPQLTLASGIWIHAQIDLLRVDGGANVSIFLTPNGGSPVAPVIDHFIPGLDLKDSRVGFVGFSGAEYAHHDIDNINVAFTAVPVPSTIVLVCSMIPCLLIWSRFQGPLDLTAKPGRHSPIAKGVSDSAPSPVESRPKTGAPCDWED
ncbi:MAG: hypothetical protein L0Y72_31435 [Gemmataceae bacterium]|nr:hypothetical protein [Gemmataceae bacterium]MCI0743565.1 hypothetical protein [Gemmataceae bacterium]